MRWPACAHALASSMAKLSLAMRTALPRSISFVTTANDRMFLYAFDLIELNGDDIRRDPQGHARIYPGRSLKSNSYHAATAERTETIACSRGGAGRAPRSEVSEARDRSGP